MPQQPGARVKTDRRDAVPLARLARSGARTAVYVPTGAEEAMRDLTRARDDPISDLQDAPLRRKAFLLRHDLRSVGRANWDPAPLRWLSTGLCPTPAQHIVLPDYLRAVSAPHERLHRLAPELQEHVNAWRLSPVVEALQALRGVQCTVAVPLVAAMGDLTRFESPRARMKGMGLMPSEYSSGEPRRQGTIPNAGTPHARRGLVEGAWASRAPATGSRPLPFRLEKQPQVSHDIRWQAQGRLCKRSRRLVARGKHAHGVTGAIARELTGCMWAIAKAVPIAVYDQDAS
jgi:transposase